MHANPARSDTEGPSRTGHPRAQSRAVASQFGITLAVVGVVLGMLSSQWLDGFVHRGILMTLIDAFVGVVGAIKDAYSVSSGSEQTRAEWPEEETSQSGAATASQMRNE